MNNRATWFLIFLGVVGFLVGGLLGLWAGWWDEAPPNPAKTVTVEKTVPGPETTVEKTVPGPERTVYKRKPGTTTWIIVCGENTQRVVNNKPTTECKLPDTGGPQ